MAQMDFDSLFGSSKGAVADPGSDDMDFGSLFGTGTAVKEAPKRNAFAYANDSVVDVINSGAGLAKAGADLVSPGGVVSKAIGSFIKSGQDSQSDWKKQSRKNLSESIANADGEVAKAVAFGKHAVTEDPLGTVTEALGQGGVFRALGLGLQAAGFGVNAATKIIMGTAGGVSAGEVRGNILEKISSTKDADLIAQNKEYASLRQSGMSEADAKKEVGTRVAQHLPELAATAAFGALGGKYGMEGIAAGVGKPAKSRIAAGGISMADEAIQGGAEQVATNVGVRRIDPRQNLGEDVLMNMVAEGLPGGVTGLASYRNPDKPETEATPPSTPSAPTGPSKSSQLVANAFAQVRGDENILAQQADTKAMIAHSLSMMEDDERTQAIQHLSGGDSTMAQQLFTAAQDDVLVGRGRELQKSNMLDEAGTGGYIAINDGIRRDSGILAGISQPSASQAATAVNAVEAVQAPQAQPVSQVNTAGFIPESIADLTAQTTAVKDGRKPAVFIGQQEAESIDLNGLQQAVLIDPNTGETGILASLDAGILKAAVARVEEVGLKQAAGEALGYVDPTATSQSNPDAVAVQQLDDQGNIVDEQILNPDQAGGVRKIDGTSMRMARADQILAERQARQQSQSQSNAAVVPGQTAPVSAAPPQKPTAVASTVKPAKSQATAQALTAAFNAQGNLTGDQQIDGDSIVQVNAPTAALSRMAKALKTAFGTSVVFVHTPNGSILKKDGTVWGGFNGVAMRDSNTIVLNINSQNPILNVLGHELAHTLQTTHPDLYDRVEEVVLSRMRLDRAVKHRDTLLAAFQMEGTAEDKDARFQEIRDELVAEGVGEMAQSPAFWRELFAGIGTNEEAAKTLYQKTTEVIHRLVKAFTNGGFVEGLRDLKVVRSAVTDAFTQWSMKYEANQRGLKASEAAAATTPAAQTVKPDSGRPGKKSTAVPLPEIKPEMLDTPATAAATPAASKTAAGFPVALNDDDPLLTNTATINTPERIKLRLDIIARHFAGHSPVAQGEGKPSMFLLGGGGGVGKTTVLRRLQDQGRMPKDDSLVKVNADDIKEMIPEYGQIKEKGDWRAAATVHEESSLITKVIQFTALGQTAADVEEKYKPYMPKTSPGKFTILIDATMSKLDTGLALIQDAQKRGFFVSMTAVVANPKSAIQRAKERGERSGRFVPNEVLGGAHSGFFDALVPYSNVVNQFSIFNNQVAQGEPPVELDITNGEDKVTIANLAGQKRLAGDSEADGSQVEGRGEGNSRAVQSRVEEAAGGEQEAGVGAGQEQSQDGVAGGLIRFSRANIEAVKNGARIAPLAVLSKPTLPMIKAGLKMTLPIRMEQSVVEKLLTGKDGLRRRLSTDEILSLQQKLQAPVAVFDDPTEKNSIVLLTDLVIDGEPVVVAIGKAPIDKTYNVDGIDHLGRKTRGASTEKASFSPLKTAYAKDLAGTLVWLNKSRMTYFNPELSKRSMTEFLDKRLAAAAEANRAYKEKAVQPLSQTAYDSGSIPSTLRQQPDELVRTADPIVAQQPLPVKKASTLTLRKPDVMQARMRIDATPIRTIEEMRDAAVSMSSWRQWYDTYEAYLTGIFGADTALFKDILSATSQAASVKANVGLALKAYRQMISGAQFEGYLEGVINNLERVRLSQAVQGAKIGEFGSANSGNDDGVAVDRHVTEAIFGVKTPNAEMIATAKSMIRSIATELGWKPKEVQAAIWAWNITRKGGVPESYDATIAQPRNQQRIRDIAAAYPKGFGAYTQRSKAATAPAGSDGRGFQQPTISIDGFRLSRDTRSVNSALSNARAISAQDLVGKKIFFMKADLTSAGTFYTGIDGVKIRAAVTGKGMYTKGGPGYPALPENAAKKLGWAVDAKGVTTKMVNNSEVADYVVIVAMQQGSHRTNRTFSNAYFQTVEAFVREGRLSEDAIGAVNALITSANNVKSKGAEGGFISTKDFPGIQDEVALEAYLRDASFEKRARLMEIMGQSAGISLGLPSLQKVENALRESMFDGVNAGDALVVIKIDTTKPVAALEGDLVHDSYDFALHGELFGVFKRPISYKLLAPKHLEKYPKINDAYYVLDRLGAEDAYTVTQEVADSVSPDPYKAIQSPAQAKIVDQWMNGGWDAMPKTGKGAVDLERELVDSVNGLDSRLYTAAEIKEGMKKGNLKIFSFRGQSTKNTDPRDGNRTWVVMEKSPDGWDVSAMVSNDPGASNILDVLLSTAVENGATSISVKDPTGDLDAVARLMGFKDTDGFLTRKAGDEQGFVQRYIRGGTPGADAGSVRAAPVGSKSKAKAATELVDARSGGQDGRGVSGRKGASQAVDSGYPEADAGRRAAAEIAGMKQGDKDNLGLPLRLPTLQSRDLTGIPVTIKVGDASLNIKDAGDAVATLQAKLAKYRQLLACLG